MQRVTDPRAAAIGLLLVVCFAAPWLSFADDDCAGRTADGAGEAWFGRPCDGLDLDLCSEGTYGCVDSQLVCTDPDDPDDGICDGADAGICARAPWMP